MTTQPTHDQLQHCADCWYHHSARQRDTLDAIVTCICFKDRPTAAAIEAWLTGRHGTNCLRATVETTFLELATAGLLTCDGQLSHSTATDSSIRPGPPSQHIPGFSTRSPAYP